MPPRRGTAVIAFDEGGLGERPGRAVDAGRARRIARGVYTTDTSTPLDRVVRDNLWTIVAHLVPDAVIVDRSAGPTLLEGNTLFVASADRTRDVELPGLRVAVRPGHAAFEDDMPWTAGLRKSSVPRALAENLAPSRARAGRVGRTLTDDELATWVAQLAQQYPPERLNRIRDRARELADVVGTAGRFGVLDEMIATALGTAPAPRRGGLLGALSAGRAWDTSRLARFAQLADDLSSGTLDPSPARLDIAATAALREQPFFEAYFSNFIEGTEFTLEEAVHLVYDGQVPAARPADAHDVTSTYELISDADDARDAPATVGDFIAQLKRRHARVMAARPEKRPGEFKEEANRFGSYQFVEPALVEATLEKGFALRNQITLPFARAVFMMFLVSEVHPFDDGNGRVARLAMNTELSVAAQQRILVPIIIRNDYLNGLRRLSREGDARLLVRVLTGAWRWSSQVDFSSLEAARVWLDRTNAVVDAADAEREGKHLLLPADLSA
jgi:hypothetical protein